MKGKGKKKEKNRKGSHVNPQRKDFETIMDAFLNKVMKFDDQLSKDIERWEKDAAQKFNLSEDEESS